MKSIGISLYREKLGDDYRFYRLDDHDRSRGISISMQNLADFVSQYKSKGGIDLFYPRVIAKDDNIIGTEEFVQDIRDEDGTVIWVNSSQDK